MNIDPSGHFAKLFKNIGNTLQTAKKVVSNTISAVKTITSNVVKATKNIVNNFTSTVKQVFNNSYSKPTSSNTSSYRTTASESSFNTAKTSTKNTTSIVQSQAKPVISTRNSPLEIVRKNIQTLKNACEGAAEIASKAYKYKDQILDVVQIGLDIAGMAPAVGNVLDGVNGVISLARGNKGDAALNFASMIPFAGLAAGAGKLVNKGSKAVDLIKVADNAASIAKASDNVTDTISAAKKGTKVVDSGFIMDLQLFGRKNADEVVEKIAKNSDEETKAVKKFTEVGSNQKEVKKLNEWLSEDKDLLDEVNDWYKDKPEWWGIDPDNTDVFYRTPDEVKAIRKKAGESGGHHPHGLALGGPEGQKLTPTGETAKLKNPTHSQVTGLQRRVINRIKKSLK